MLNKLNLDETLRQGATGPKVQQLQEILTVLNLNPGTIDGDFGVILVIILSKPSNNFKVKKGLKQMV
jgi:lysozyme